jgi:hypothetical protein
LLNVHSGPGERAHLLHSPSRVGRFDHEIRFPSPRGSRVLVRNSPGKPRPVRNPVAQRIARRCLDQVTVAKRRQQATCACLRAIFATTSGL